MASDDGTKRLHDVRPCTVSPADPVARYTAVGREVHACRALRSALGRHRVTMVDVGIISVGLPHLS